MARNYVALPFEYTREMRKLSDEDFGRLVRALLLYSETGDATEPEGFGAFYWERVMTKENQFQAKFQEVDAVNTQRARKAAAARWNTSVDAPSMLEHAPDANNKDKDKDKDNNNVFPSSEGKDDAFAPPSGEEVASYCREAGLSADPEAFVDYYASRGWKVGTVPMTDWRAALRSWARREHAFPSRASPPAENYTAPTVPTAKDLQTMAQLERLRQKMTAGQGCTQPKTPRDGPGE